jgi:UDP-glucose 4-epimerase
VKVLVTGGFGYLGGRLSQFLESQKEYQIALGCRHQQSGPPLWLPQAEVVRVRWDSPDKLQDTCTGVDTVVHLAGMNAQDCQADPSTAFEVNAVATGRLVDAAIKAGVKRFIYLSTAHVYGSPLTGVISEETCPVNLHPYATSHRAGEDLLRNAHQCGEIEAVVIRLSNAFGAPAHKDVNCWMLLANDLCRQAVTSRQLVLRKSGVQRRDFIPLSDVCRVVEHLLQLPKPELGDGVFNTGGKWSPTVWEMACIIQQRCKVVLGFEPEIIRPAPKSVEVTDALDYRIDKLSKTGFQLKAGRNEEIDYLIKFCDAEFN